MSTVNNGPQIVKNSLAFVLDPSVSAGFIKTPKQISNCIAWFDGNDSGTMTLSSNIVSAWADKSGNSYVFNSAQLSALPANNFSPLYVSNKINGLGSLYFDGSNDYMFVNSGMGLASATQYTAFIILSPVYLNASQVAFGMQATPSGGTYEILGYWSTLDTFTVGFDGGVVLVNTTSRSDNRSIIHSVVRNGTSANAYLNGFQYATNTTVASTVNSGVARLGIGANTYVNGSAPYKGYISEIIIYNRALSNTERYQVQNYLANKWRIPLLQPTLTNRDLVFGKVATCQNNNIPVIDKSYRVNPANATGSPLQNNFYFNDSVSWMSSAVTTSITLEAWVKPNSFSFAGTNTDLGGIMIANSNFYLSLDGNGKFNAFMYGSAGSTSSHQPSTTSVTRHAWNHVVWTFDGAYIRWYLNGVLDKTSSTTFTIGTINITNYLGIGAEGASTYGRMLDGYVAGCKVYGKALSGAEIAQNYESSKTEFSNLPNLVTSGLVRYYDADVYSSYIGSGTSLVDLTGTSNSIISNSPVFLSTDPKNFVFVGSSNHYFTLSSAITSNETTIIIWARTSANRFLFLSGQTTSYYIMATDGGGAWYSQNAGTPTYYVDTVLSSDPTTSNALDNQYHMFEMRKADFSTWSTNIIGYYGSSSSFNFTGNIAAILIYNRNITSAESSQIYNYFKYRFGK